MTNPKVNLDVNFSIRFGEMLFNYEMRSNADVIVIVGPSGYGKSTFLNALLSNEKVNGLIKFDELWFSSEKGINLPIESRKVAWVPQSHLLFPHLTVLENLKFGLEENVSFPKDVETIIEAFELRSILEKRPRVISGGESQRIAIGRALLSTLRFSKGGLLLLDEPYASLDSKLAQKVSAFVFHWCANLGIIPVFSVHEIDRIGGWRELTEVDISAYLLTKDGSEIRTEALALPTHEKTV